MSRRVAGAVPWRMGATGVEVLLVHRVKHQDWALPKGAALRGESIEQCAVREVEEETGLRCAVDWELPSASYLDGTGVRRTVHYWAARPLSGQFRPNVEVDETRWLPPADALSLLSEPRERPMVVAVAYALAQGEIASGERPRRVILLRRAAVLPRDKWHGHDDERPLREEGMREADALRALAVTFDVEAVLSSPALRCVQTVEPLARALRRPVRVLDNLVERDASAALQVVREAHEGGLVLCTHESVIAGVLTGLVEQDGLVLTDRIRRRRASAWCLEFVERRCVSAMYIPSPETIVPEEDLAEVAS